MRLLIVWKGETVLAKTVTIEESFRKLEDIIAQLEGGELSLEDSFKQYNEGLKLIKSCNQQLDKVEKKMIVIEHEGMKDDETV